VQGLGEVVPGHLQLLGDLVDAGGLASIGEEEHGSQGVFGGVGEHGLLGGMERRFTSY
jgi:hypothetical protein